MIKITIYQNSKQEYIAFRCIGHAGYAEAGEDIICAAVSALVLNTVNSMEMLLSEPFDITADPDSGLIDFSLKKGYSEEALLLIRSLILGLQGIQKSYGTDYLTLTFTVKEV